MLIYFLSRLDLAVIGKQDHLVLILASVLNPKFREAACIGLGAMLHEVGLLDLS